MRRAQIRWLCEHCSSNSFPIESGGWCLLQRCTGYTWKVRNQAISQHRPVVAVDTVADVLAVAQDVIASWRRIPPTDKVELGNGDGT